jgi:hypothetical protein
MTHRITAVCVICLFGCPSGGFAQATQVPVDHQQAITASPFLGLAGWVEVDYEHKLGPATTVGVVGSGNDFDFERYRSARALLRFYPQGAALSGFYVGTQAGIYRFDDRSVWSRQAGATQNEFDGWDSALGFGFDSGYNWLLGTDRRVSVGLGFGLTRLFGRDAGRSEFMPTARLINVGVAF